MKKTRQTEEEAGRQHQRMDRPGVCQVPEGSGEQGKMEETGCEIICGALTTLAVKEQTMMMSRITHDKADLCLGLIFTLAYQCVIIIIIIFLSFAIKNSRSGELRTQRTQSLNVLSFKPGVGKVYSHTCYAYCQGFLSCLFLHFKSIHLHFFQNLSRFFSGLAVANTWFLCKLAE